VAQAIQGSKVEFLMEPTTPLSQNAGRGREGASKCFRHSNGRDEADNGHRKRTGRSQLQSNTPKRTLRLEIGERLSNQKEEMPRVLNTTCKETKKGKQPYGEAR